MPDPNSLNLEGLLAEFANHADEWFQNRMELIEFHRFILDFFDADRLRLAEWHQFQALANHLHSLNSVALAKGNAFGRPNYPMEKYRESFEFLAHGPGSIEERMRIFRGDKEAYASKYLGDSVVSELIGQLFADKYVFMNRRDIEAAEFLGLTPSYPAGSDFPARFTAFNVALAPLFEAYARVVGNRSGLPLGLEVDQFLSWVYKEKLPGKVPIGDKPSLDEAQIWVLAPGPKARFWNECRTQSIGVFGADLLGPLDKFASKDEILQEIKIKYSKENEPTNDALAAWQFCRVMKEGDLVIAKKGNRKFIGVGIVRGGYRYDASRPEYPNVRDIDWTHEGEWLVPDGESFTMKTLTNISRFPDFVSKLFAEAGVDMPDKPREVGTRYFWLNCAPDIWRVSACAVGEEQTYTTHNEEGNKRQVYGCFKAVRPGDLIIGYETTPIQKVTSVLEITQGIHQKEGEGESIRFRVLRHLPKPLTLHELRGNLALADCGPVQGKRQGSLFQLTKHEYDAILSEPNGSGVDVPEIEELSVQDAMKGLFMAESDFQEWLKQWTVSKNLILCGPPGVGKTFVARRLAYALMKAEDPKRIAMIQFHQSYGYEDFVQGYRPGLNQFELRNGSFYEFCLKAKESQDQSFVFIIDEVNRGNLSRIFGELLMLIEPDKRGENYALRLAYQGENQSFFVPENVFILGLMNTADRSLAVVDYALRRRFRFAEMHPAIRTEAFRDFLTDGCEEGLADRIIRKVGSLNDFIAKDVVNLGPGFCIGHSYFCQIKSQIDYMEVIRYQIAPLLREYWFDAPKKAEEWIQELLSL